MGEVVRIGTFDILPVFETEAGGVLQEVIEGADPTTLQRMGWLYPDYIDQAGRFKAVVQAFIIKALGTTIVVDPGIGDGRSRPGIPSWSNLQTNFSNTLSGICAPDEVDTVVCTHLHFDHVGWNTRLAEGGAWRPTFPNAQYIFIEGEFNYWRDESEPIPYDFWRESIQPVWDAGLVSLVPDNYHVTEGISFLPTPGHTPHHASILIESAGESAVISGDALHHPSQIAHPEWKSLDTDSEAANRTRRSLLGLAAARGMLLIGSHFADPVAVGVEPCQDGFRII